MGTEEQDDADMGSEPERLSEALSPVERVADEVERGEDHLLWAEDAFRRAVGALELAFGDSNGVVSISAGVGDRALGAFNRELPTGMRAVRRDGAVVVVGSDNGLGGVSHRRAIRLLEEAGGSMDEAEWLDAVSSVTGSKSPALICDELRTLGIVYVTDGVVKLV